MSQAVIGVASSTPRQADTDDSSEYEYGCTPEDRKIKSFHTPNTWSQTFGKKSKSRSNVDQGQLVDAARMEIDNAIATFVAQLPQLMENDFHGLFQQYIKPLQAKLDMLQLDNNTLRGLVASQAERFGKLQAEAARQVVVIAQLKHRLDSGQTAAAPDMEPMEVDDTMQPMQPMQPTSAQAQQQPGTQQPSAEVSATAKHEAATTTTEQPTRQLKKKKKKSKHGAQAAESAAHHHAPAVPARAQHDTRGNPNEILQALGLRVPRQQEGGPGSDSKKAVGEKAASTQEGMHANTYAEAARNALSGAAQQPAAPSGAAKQPAAPSGPAQKQAVSSTADPCKLKLHMRDAKAVQAARGLKQPPDAVVRAVMHDHLRCRCTVSDAAWYNRGITFRVGSEDEARRIKVLRRRLRGKPLAVYDALTAAEQQQFDARMPMYISAKRANKRAWWDRARLYIDGRPAECYMAPPPPPPPPPPPRQQTSKHTHFRDTPAPGVPRHQHYNDTPVCGVAQANRLLGLDGFEESTAVPMEMTPPPSATEAVVAAIQSAMQTPGVAAAMQRALIMQGVHNGRRSVTGPMNTPWRQQ